MIDGTCGVSIKSVVGLNANIYTCIAENDHEFKRAKGINENVVAEIK